MTGAPTAEAAVRISELSFAYGNRRALTDIHLEIARREVFAFLGPNGGGKTTLFRLLSTLVPLQSGRVELLGFDLARDWQAVRSRIGVVFQAPSLDKKLTVSENIRHQGALYGIPGRELREREGELLERFGLRERAGERTESLSGGLRRRVELAKGLVHRPELLLLDEPSTGLDPGARRDLWEHLWQLRDRDGVTVALTTHLLEEAEKSDRIAILDRGRLVAMDAPDALRATLGGDSITISSENPGDLAERIRERFQVEATIVDGCVRLEQSDAGRWIMELVEAFPGRIQSVTLAKPSLEDVFINLTGRRFESAASTEGVDGKDVVREAGA